MLRILNPGIGSQEHMTLLSSASTLSSLPSLGLTPDLSYNKTSVASMYLSE